MRPNATRQPYTHPSSETRYSLRGAFACFRLLQRYSKLAKGCFPGQQRIATELHAGVSTVEGWIRQLKHLQAIEVAHRGPRSSKYSVLWKNCDTWQRFLELADENEGASKKSGHQPLTAKNEGACEGAFEGAFGVASITELIRTPSGVELGSAKPAAIQHHSSSVSENDVDACGEKLPPENQDPNQEAAISEVWAVAKARVVVQCGTLTEANKSAIREMLHRGGSVEVATHAVFEGSWRKVKAWDNAARNGFRDESRIRSFNYFLTLIDEARHERTLSVGIPPRWRHIEERVKREEKKWRQPQASTGTIEPLAWPPLGPEAAGGAEFSNAATAMGWRLVQPDSNCRKCYGFGRRNIETAEVCGCEAGQKLERVLALVGHANVGKPARPDPSRMHSARVLAGAMTAGGGRRASR